MAKTAQIRFPSPKRVRPPYPQIPSGAISAGSDIERSVRFAVGTVTASSTTSLPLDAVVNQVTVRVTTSYSPGATLQISRGGVILLATTAFPDPIAAETYVDFPDAVIAAAGIVTAAVGGGPAAGDAIVSVQYSVPGS